MTRLTNKDFLYHFALLIVSTAVFMLYMSLATQNHFSPLEPMINGTAARPYVYRILTPFIVRIFSNVLNISPFLSAVFIMFVTMLGALWLILALSKIFLPQYPHLFAILAPLGLIPFLLEQRYIYDFPTLFLFTLALFYLAKRKFYHYIMAFVLATFSKETSLFLLIFFVIQFRKMERKQFLLLIFVQVTLYTLIRLALILIFNNNSGSLLEFHLYDHLKAYLHRPINAIVLFFAIISLMGVSVFHSTNRSDFVQNSLLAIGGPTLLLYFFFGVPFEVRIFLESYPSMFLAVSLATISFLSRFAKVEYFKNAD